MAESILDGKGSGYRAKVNSEGNLHTQALTVPHIAHHSKDSHHQDSYIIYSKHQTVAGNTDENAVVCTYTGDQYLTIHSMVVSTTATVLKLEMIFDPVGISGGYTRTPINLNRGSAKKLNVSLIDTNGGVAPITITTLDKSLEIFDLRIDQYSPKTLWVPLDTAIYMVKNSSFMLLTNTSTIGDKMRFSFLAFEDEKEV